MATDLAYSYAALEKADKNPDGTLTVYGKATDDSVDIDQQICDDAWLKKAMPDWMLAGGNVREQHSNIAAGVATEYEVKSDGHYITALVVDPVSVKKVETGVLKGFSIGIRGPRVIRDNKAAGGRIVDGQIVEVSLVDRPANPNAKLMLAKAVDGGLLEAVTETLKYNENHDEGGRFSSGDGAGSSAQSADRESLKPHEQVSYDQFRTNGVDHESAVQMARRSTNRAETPERYMERAKLGEGAQHYDNFRANGMAHDDAMQMARNTVHADANAKSSTPTPKDVANMMKKLNKSDDIVDAVVEPDLVDAPVEDAPVAEDAPVEEAPVVEDAPATDAPVEDAEKSVHSDIVKGDIDLYNNAVMAITALIKSEADEVVTEGDDEKKDIIQLLKSLKHLQKWHKIEFEKGELPALPSDNADDDDAYTPSVIEMSANAEDMPAVDEDKADMVDDEVCEKCNKSMDECKCDKTDEGMGAEKSVSFDDTQIESVIEKAVASAKASVTEELESLKTAIKAVEAEKVQLMEDLDTARKAAVAGGPKRSTVRASESVKSELLQKASEYRMKASATLDKALATGYREMADDLETKASRKDVN